MRITAVIVQTYFIIDCVSDTIYKIISIIFPKENFDINRIKDELSYPLEIYNSTGDIEKLKKEIHDITNQLLEILKNGKI